MSEENESYIETIAATTVQTALLDTRSRTEKQIENNFTYHAPTATKAETYKFLRGRFKTLAYNIDNVCPDSREKSLALTKLEEAMMWANASIARNE